MIAAGLAIGLAIPADVDGIMACERRPGYEDTVGRWDREEHLSSLESPTSRYFVGRVEAAVAGFVMLQEIGAPSGSVLVRRVAVARQRQGYGEALLSYALAFIFGELHAQRAHLYVWPHNASGIALYRKLGMRAAGFSNDERDGVRMTIMAIDAETFRERRSESA